MTKTYIRFVEFKGEVLAVFMRKDAQIRCDHRGMWLRACYAHNGQHGECYDGMERRKQARFFLYEPLLKELVGLGYKNIVVLNTETWTCRRPPTKAEIRFGEGAWHYREFNVAKLLLTPKFTTKKWFKSQDDNLRYYL